MAFSIPLELQSGFMGYHPVNPDLKLSGSAPLTVAGVVNGVLKGKLCKRKAPGSGRQKDYSG